MTPEEFDRWYEASRAASGVPYTVEDETGLLNLARLMRGVDEHIDGGGPTASRRRRRVKEPSTTRRATRKAGGADEPS